LKRRIVKAAAIVSAILLVAYISLLLTVSSTIFQEWIRAEIALRTGYDISARDIRLDPLLRLTLTDMTASRAERLTLQAQRVLIVPSFTTLFSRSIHRLELERPVLSFDLYEFFTSTKKDASDVSIRHLIVEDGTLILTSGAGRKMDFRSVTMSIDNFNLGAGIGLRLRAAIPSLGGVAAVTMQGSGDETEAVVRLEQSGDTPGGLVQAKNRQTFETKIKMTWRDNGAIQVSAEGKLDAMRVADSSFSGGLSMSAEIDPSEKEAGLTASARLSGLDLLLRRPKQIELSAKAIRGGGKLEWKQDEPVKVSGAMQVEQGAFASADGTKIGEKLSLEARLDSIRIDNGISLAGTVDAHQGEVLWKKFYGDLKAHRPTLELDAEYNGNDDLLRLRRADLALASVGKVALHGEFANVSKDPIAQVKVTSDAIQSAGIFEFFIRDTLNRSYPVLNRLTVAGRINLSAEASGPLYKPSIAGTIALQAGEIGARSNDWRVSGIDIALPFRVGYPVALAKTPADTPATGKLTIGSAKFGAEIMPPITTTISLWNNVLRLHQPIRLPIYGGSLVISDLAWKDVIATPQAASLALEATNLQLQRLTEALGWYRFGGSLSGSIPKIEWTGESLRSKGQIDIAVFGGRLLISPLEIENPFSPVPSIKLDARFENIQLEQASETFAFGRISGVLAGTVNNLAVTAGQPSTFIADVHSVEQSGVSQRISVESLNKITVLSSGRDAGALYSGIAGFFDSFRYSKLGFKATLKNDKLTLRGIESRGGQEYLVVGSFIPPTVNVISHTQEIAFLELLRRLERIQKTDSPQKSSS
jgi:hypothetical protein